MINHTIAASLAFLALGSVSVQPATAVTAEESQAVAPDTIEAAMRRYRETIDRLDRKLAEHPLSRNATVRAQGRYYTRSMESVAFSMYVAPLQQYPMFYNQSNPMLTELSWGAPNPDFIYNDVFIDGAQTYRIFGNRTGSFFSTLQVFEGFWGDEKHAPFALVDFDDLPKTANGDFEIFLGPNPPAERNGQVWVKTDPKLDNMFLILREVIYDWSNQKPLDLRIEILDRKPDAQTTLSEAEIIRRIGKAEKFVRVNIPNFDFTLEPLRDKSVTNRVEYVRNRFFRYGEDTAQYGGNPLACYATMIYDIKPDEALIFEVTPPGGHYWGFQIFTPWGQTADYINHTSSTNRAQARLDADGKLRAVVALKDPGVPNWLDTVGSDLGFTGMRYYKTTSCPVPEVKKVKLTDVRRYLPKDTPVITPEQRKTQLASRRAAAAMVRGK